MDRKILVVSLVAYPVTLCTVPGDVLSGVPGILAFGLFAHGSPAAALPERAEASISRFMSVIYIERPELLRCKFLVEYR